MLDSTTRQQRLAEVDALRARVAALPAQAAGDSTTREFIRDLHSALDDTVATLYRQELQQLSPSPETVRTRLEQAARRLEAIERALSETPS